MRVTLWCCLLALCLLSAATDGQIVFGDASGGGGGGGGGGSSVQSCINPEGLQGTCDVPDRCPALRPYIERRDASYIRRAYCGRSGGRILLCCADSGRTPSTPDSSILSGSNSFNQPETGSATVNPPRTSSSSASGSGTCSRFRSAAGCGRSPFIPSRVVNGVPVRSLADFPWMVALRYRSRPVYRCGGTIISDRWVLTAAHCILTDGPVSVVVSDLNLSTDADDSATYPPQTLAVQRAVTHPDFRRMITGKNKGIFNDIALIQLAQPIQFSATVKPLCIADRQSSISELEGSQAFVAGWGATEFGGLTSPMMQWGRLEVTDHQECERNYARRGNLVDGTQLCASGENERGGVDTCHGDSGGPLMVQRFANNRNTWQAIGIVSYGTGCGNPEIPGVYTHISAFLDWIGCTVNGN